MGGYSLIYSLYLQLRNLYLFIYVSIFYSVSSLARHYNTKKKDLSESFSLWYHIFVYSSVYGPFVHSTHARMCFIVTFMIYNRWNSDQFIKILKYHIAIYPCVQNNEKNIIKKRKLYQTVEPMLDEQERLKKTNPIWIKLSNCML